MRHLTRRQLRRLMLREVRLLSEADLEKVDPPETITDPEVFTDESEIMEQFQKIQVALDKIWTNQQAMNDRIKELEGGSLEKGEPSSKRKSKDWGSKQTAKMADEAEADHWDD